MIQRRVRLMLMMSAALAAGTAFAQGGGEGSKGGGGGDVITGADHMQWFTVWPADDMRRIRYCLSIAPEFGMSEAEVDRNVRDTFAYWRRYRNQRVVANRSGVRFPEELERVDCNHTGVDLKLYFGSTSSEVEAARVKYLRPFAFAQQTGSSDEEWGSGFIWFANPGTVKLPGLGEVGREVFPNWSKEPNQLYAALLHEWGHVLGCSHIDGTIMQEDYWKFLSSRVPQEDQRYRSRIDHERELQRGFVGTMHLTAEPAVWVLSMKDDWKEDGGVPIFERFISSLKLKRNGLKVSLEVGPEMETFRVSFIDGRKEVKLDLDELEYSNNHEGGATFGTSFKDDEMPNISVMLSGGVQLSKRKRVMFELEYNSNGEGASPFELFLIVNARRVHIASFADVL
jgi:hypothetical protein